MEDIVFYIMDAGVLCLFIYMLWRSRSVVIESKVGNKWIVAGLFFLLGLVGFMNYRPFFTWFQMIFMAVIAVMYMLLKSGLTETGIVMVGSFISFEKAGRITLYKKDRCISFDSRGRKVDLFFDEGQMEEVRSWLKKYCTSGINTR
ncbi:MAG: hypothetical protein E7185_01740 [Erysipelotrichaceae bacterium]|nr:hypothetical protein [Erysipelotrichaceae bacterium]